MIGVSLIIVDSFCIHNITRRNHVCAMLSQIILQAKFCTRMPWRFSSHNQECIFGEVHSMAGSARELTMSQLEALFRRHRELQAVCEARGWTVPSSEKSQYGMHGIYHRQDKRCLDAYAALSDDQVFDALRKSCTIAEVLLRAGGWRQVPCPRG